MFKKAIIFTLLATAVAIITPKATFAQYFHLSISPPLLEAAIKPGKSIIVAYTIKNGGDPLVLYPIIKSFEPRGSTGKILLKNGIEGPVRFRLDNSNLRLNKAFLLKNKESNQLLLRIRVPDNAPEGDYYYTLLLQSAPTPPKEGVSTTATKAAIGTNILITVTNSGKLDLKGKIAILSVLPHYKIKIFKQTINLFDSTDKIPLVLIIANKGRNLIKAHGSINLKGPFGTTAKYKIIPENILAYSERLIRTKNSLTKNCKESVCQKPTTLLLSGFFIGRYTFSADVNFGEGSSVLYNNVSFIALPIKALAIIILTAIITATVLYKRTKN